MPEYSVIGKPLPQLNLQEKVTGEARFVADLKPPGALTGMILRSPFPHARIVSIDAKRAKALRGVKAVITGADMPDLKWGFGHKDSYLLAKEKVRFIGEEVAAVAAEDEHTAMEALELIDVEYEELPAVVDTFEAMQEGAPVIHEDYPNNIVEEVLVTRGDIEAGFREADCIHEAAYSTQMQNQCFMEPIGALAQYDASERLTMWVSTQVVFFARQMISDALGLDLSRVRVIQPYVGGGFGGKSFEEPSPIIAGALAMRTDRPVFLLKTRLEEFQAGRPRVPARITLKMGMKKDGAITAKQTTIVSDNGAYSCLAPEILKVTAYRVDSLYRQRNISTVARLVFTNKVPTGAQRGFGNPQMTFAMESHLETMADMLGLDPREVRLRNATQVGDTSVHGWQMKSCGLTECIEKGAAAIGWERRNAPKAEGNLRRGIGMACGIHVTANRQLGDWDGSTAILKINEDGRVNLVSGEGDIGQGSYTVLAQIAAEELGLDPRDVFISNPDTDVAPYSFGGIASRLTMVAGNAVRLAAIDARNQLFEVAAKHLEASPDDLVIGGGRITVKGAPDRSIATADVCRMAIFRAGGATIYAKVTYDTPTVMPDENHYGNVAPAYSFVTQYAEVEVDIETGQVRVVRMVGADDVGKALNPLAVEGQVQSEIIQGIGFGLCEEIVHEGGQVINGNFADYSIPKADHLPEIESIMIETIDPNGPYGAKAVSECSTSPPAPAIANAICNAVGVRITSLPITPEKIIQALRAKEQGA